jgi:type I restriction enzyme S subunit
MKFNEVSLLDAVEFIVDNRGKSVPIDDAGFPLIATNCISNNRLYPEFKNIRYVSQNIYDNWFRSHPLPNDIIITNKGSQNGAVCLVPNPVTFCIAQDMVALRAKHEVVYPFYLLAALRSEQVQYRIKNLNVDAVIPHLKKTDFNKLFFPLPDYEVQKRVGDFYFRLCSKIELNFEINRTLEQMAQAIFKSWFVDFEPVKAKIAALEADGSEEDALLASMQAISGKDEAQLNHLRAEQPEQYVELRVTANLFPASMHEGECGAIPEGWMVSSIGTEVEVKGGGTPPTKNKEYWEEGTIHWSSPKDLSNSQSKVMISTERKITEAGLSKISSGLLPEDTVLMSSRAPVGYLALAKIPVAINQGYIGMVCKKRLQPEYVIQWAASVMDDIKQRSSGTTFAEISKKNFREIPVIVPSDDLISRYCEIARTQYSAIELNLRNSNDLSEIRDSLLPKLLSGELEA